MFALYTPGPFSCLFIINLFLYCSVCTSHDSSLYYCSILLLAFFLNKDLKKQKNPPEIVILVDGRGHWCVCVGENVSLFFLQLRPLPNSVFLHVVRRCVRLLFASPHRRQLVLSAVDARSTLC